MSKKILTQIMLKKFARGEISLYCLLGVKSLSDLPPNVKVESSYEFGIHDVGDVLQKLVNHEISQERFYDWWSLLSDIEDDWRAKAFCLCHAFGLDKQYKRPWPVLPETDADWCYLIFSELDDFMQNEENLPLEEAKHLLSYFPMMLYNKGKNPENREYPIDISLAYLRCNDDRMWGERGPWVTADEKMQFRGVLDKLATAKIAEAERIKAYHCYGGSPLYSCDWQTAHDLLLDVFAQTKEPAIANSLGYIFYYGRCTNDVPEYEKAFAYFSYAAAHGVIEAIYKMADLYAYGNGCLQSEVAAMHLLSKLYEEQLPLFCQGNSIKFADIALRMGKLYEDGIGTFPNPAQAYYYYLQADYAIRQRQHDYDFYGDAKVCIRIQNALKRLRAKIEIKSGNKAGVFLSDILQHVLSTCDAIELSFVKKDNGALKIKVRPLDKIQKDKQSKIFVTIPEYAYCNLQDEIILHRKRDKSKNLPLDKIQVTEIRISYLEDSCQFYRYGKYLFSLSDRRYDLKLIGRIKAMDEKIRIAQVVFEHNSRRYDYLCDSLKVKKGDWIRVSGAASGRLVYVTNVYTCHKSELRLPFERYEHVISVESRKD